MKKDTLVTIAKRTGYSVSTVSRVLSGNAERHRISAATAERIMEETQKSNYIPNILAKGLRTRKTNTIGLVIPYLENSFYAKIASVVMREVHSFGYRVMVIDTLDDLQNETDAVTTLLSQSVDGILAVPCATDASIYKKADVPVVFIYRYIPQSDSIPFVTADNYAGAVLAMEYLLVNGHTNILCIRGDLIPTTDHDRVRGITDTVKKHSIEGMVKIRGGEQHLGDGYVETKRALESDDVPTAIFALGETVLMGVIKALKESGKRVPEDISVVSIDDNDLFDYLEPSITCVRQPVNEFCSLSVKQLMKEIQREEPAEGEEENPAEEPAHLFLAPNLIIRKSVRRIGKPV